MVTLNPETFDTINIIKSAMDAFNDVEVNDMTVGEGLGNSVTLSVEYTLTPLPPITGDVFDSYRDLATLVENGAQALPTVTLQYNKIALSPDDNSGLGTLSLTITQVVS